MNQFIGTVVTAMVVSFICTRTKFGKMTFSAVDEAIEHFAKLREYARKKRMEDKKKGKDTVVEVSEEDIKPEPKKDV